MLTYSATLDYLFALRRFGVKLGLEAITDILQQLKNPQHQYATLHIAGTNGKGSSAAMLAAMLQAGGYRVGLYTSPHLIDFRERIRVQGAEISEKAVCELTESIRRLVDRDGSLTFFEFTTALAFHYFYQQQVDIAVVEVGLGGRCDATNVLNPLGVLITGIGMDHEMHLGSTLHAIAREKAGIIHSQVPVVLGQMSESVRQTFEHVAQTNGAPLYRHGQEFSVFQTTKNTFSYYGFTSEFVNLQTNLLGCHQMHNAGNALALLEAATAQQFPLSFDAIKSGLQHVRWKGRLEVVQYNPMVILDGAHNPLGAQVLFDFLQAQLHDACGGKLIVVLGMMHDKQHAEFLRILCPLIDTVIVTQLQMSRSMTVDELQHVVPQDQMKLCMMSDPWKAYCKALEMATPADVICVTGSLFLVGEMLQHLTPPHSSIGSV